MNGPGDLVESIGHSIRWVKRAFGAEDDGVDMSIFMTVMSYAEVLEVRAGRDASVAPASTRPAVSRGTAPPGRAGRAREARGCAATAALRETVQTVDPTCPL